MAYGASNQVIHVQHDSDLFEISLQGYVIARITCYVGGRHRQDFQFDDLPQAVKDVIINKVEQIIRGY